MNKLLLLLAFFTLTSLTSSALEPINIAIINTSGGPVDVQVKLNDYTTGTPSLKYEGPINSLTPNGSGVIIVEVDNNTGTEWSDIDADQVNPYYVLDVYVESSLYAQFRLDQQILNQSQANIIDNNGNLSPPIGTSSLGTDNNRWEDAYISQNTLHVGPDGGMTGGTEMTLSYDIPTNSGRLNIDGTVALTAKATGVTIPNALTMTNLGGSGNRNIGVDNDGNIVINTSAGVTAGDGLTIDGSNDLDVGGSATIIANADNVEVNSSATANQVLLSSGTVGTAASYGAVPLDNSNSVSGTLSVANGGTGATNLATGNFLQGNGTGAVTATKVIPTGTVVGTTDAQTLTNKTIDANSNTITNIFPDSTGKSGQYLKTEDGNLKWETVSPSAFTSAGGQTTINNLTDNFIVGDATLAYDGSDTDTKMFFDNNKGAFRAGTVNGTEWDDVNIGFQSTALGFSTTGSGDYSTAMGLSSTANGFISTAMGESTIASGSSSTSMGRYTIADEPVSTAMGEFNDNTVSNELLTIGNGIYGSRSNAFEVYMNGDVVVPALSGTGNRNIGVDATGKLKVITGGGAFTSAGGQTTINNLTDDFIVGAATLDYGGSGTETKMFFDDSKGAFRAGSIQSANWNDANIGENSFATGNTTLASGAASVALGYGTTASGDYSKATGYITNATGDYSSALGYGTTASGNNSTALGSTTTASGVSSFAVGSGSAASANVSTAFGSTTTASGDNSTAMGSATIASGDASTAMGQSTNASGFGSTAMGQSTEAIGTSSTAMGQNTDAIGFYSTAMGNGTTASGDASVAIGSTTSASGANSTAMGVGTTASQTASTAMGNGTIASGHSSTAMGFLTTASGANSTAMGNTTIASGNNSTALGNTTRAEGLNSTAMGLNTTASSDNSTAMGNITTASGVASTAMGSGTSASGANSTAMGSASQAIGINSTAMGQNSNASGSSSIAMGNSATASGNSSVAMGLNTTASGDYSTAIGSGTTASLPYSTAMGLNTTASGSNSTAIGYQSTASGLYSTAMGNGTTASGQNSTAIGIGTIADANNSVALGSYNDNTITGELLTIGNGVSDPVRSNAFEVYMNGDVVVPALSGTGNRNIGVDSDGKLIEVGSGGAFTSFGGQTTINNLTDDFIVGDATLDYDGSGADTKMFFDDSKGAFRAGSVTDGSWDDGANIGVNSFALGRNTKANGTLSTAMGSGTTASGESSTAMGNSSTASGESSTAMGNSSTASGESSTAMGYRTEASDDYSVAMGYESEASGSTSFAMGRETFASGDFTVAMGYETSATENYSTAMGYRTQANGQHSFAIGQSSKASGENSHAIGYFSEAEGWHTTAIGYESIARGDYSFAVGYKANAGGWASTAMGDSSNATGDYSTTTGYHTTASGYYATAMGHNTISPSFAETAIGAYNTDYTIATDGDTQWNAADRLFVIGNGTGTGSKSDAMIVYKNGNADLNGDVTISNNLSVSNDATFSKFIKHTVEEVSLKANLVNVTSSIVNFTENTTVVSGDLPLDAQNVDDGTIIYFRNGNATAISVCGTTMPGNTMVVLVKISNQWYPTQH